MTTATEKRINEMQEEREQFMFEGMARRFFERWQPEDRRDAAQFNAEFFTLVRQIHIDAAEPMRKTMTQVLSTALFPAPIIKVEK